MARRFHLPSLSTGDLSLDASQARHARDVLRLEVGTIVDLFDDTGRTATGEIVTLSPDVVVRVASVSDAPLGRLHLTVASAVPKGNRADWMIEKLAEIGVDRFIPLQTARSVVAPEGRGKLDRWQRIATEAAKQSKRTGTMAIEPLTDVKKLPIDGSTWCLSTGDDAMSTTGAVATLAGAESLTLLIGPEGGWTDAELNCFRAAGAKLVSLTESVLRVETAAIAAAVIAKSFARASDAKI